MLALYRSFRNSCIALEIQSTKLIIVSAKDVAEFSEGRDAVEDLKKSTDLMKALANV